jgi:hypothetical protein
MTRSPKSRCVHALSRSKNLRDGPSDARPREIPESDSAVTEHLGVVKLALVASTCE